MAEPLILVCVSYVPLLEGGAGQVIDAEVLQSPEFKAKLGKLEKLQECVGVLWGIEDGKLHPVLLHDRADEIASHLRLWSEGKPEEWFTLHFYEHNNHLAILLFPDVEKSIERLKLALSLQHIEMKDEIAKAEARILCAPLVYRSKPGMGEVYGKNRNNLPDEMRLCMIKTSDVEGGLPREDAVEYPIGTFKVKRNDPFIKSYVEPHFE